MSHTNGLQKIIAADRIRRQRAREAEADRLHGAYQDGVRRGREPRPPPEKVPVDLVEAVTRRMVDYMASEAVQQNRERAGEVIHILAAIVTDAVKRYPWDFNEARQYAEYVVDKQGVRFDFGLLNLHARHQIDRTGLELARWRRK